MGIVFDTREDGFRTVVKDYQEMALRFLWESGERGVSSREVWLHVNKEFGGSGSISRASLINFLNAMVDEGVLGYTEITGKGGHRRIYSTKLNEAEFKKYVATTVLKNLLRDFPSETKQVLSNFR